MSYLAGFRPPVVLRRCAGVLGLTAALTTALTGCYVVPLHPAPGSAAPAAAPVSMVSSLPVTMNARLYPANDLASGFGVIQAMVTNDLHGRGQFSTQIGGELFSGEATRKVGASREGLASGAGNRGSYISCQYQMNSATLGLGQCKLSNGAVFTLHVGG
jgi:hypothetical protein